MMGSGCCFGRSNQNDSNAPVTDCQETKLNKCKKIATSQEYPPPPDSYRGGLDSNPISDLPPDQRGAGEGKVKIRPKGKVYRVDGGQAAQKARKSMAINEEGAKPDKRRRELVHEFIYKKGGYIYDRNTGQREFIRPGTPMPGKTDTYNDDDDITELDAVNASAPAE